MRPSPRESAGSRSRRGRGTWVAPLWLRRPGKATAAGLKLGPAERENCSPELPRKRHRPTLGDVRRALVVVNPRARGGKDPLDDALRVFAAAGVAIKTAPFEAVAEPTAMRACAAGADAIVVCGGDGTVRAAAAGVIAAGVPLGIVP